MIMRASTLRCFAVLCSLVCEYTPYYYDLRRVNDRNKTEAALSRPRFRVNVDLTTVAQLRARNLLPVNQMRYIFAQD